MGVILLLLFMTSISLANVPGMTRLKDLVYVKGVRENPIVGYGLVVGLNGTGDSASEIIDKSMKNMMQKLGFDVKQEISSKNIASAIITAKFPPFGRMGQKIDVTISSIGDASSLAGGTLLITPLKGGDDQVYAVASGQISIGGLNKGKAFPTTGIISGGAVIEKEIPSNFHKKRRSDWG